LGNAKGLAIITQVKAGFLFSGRAGSGVIVARLPDGQWSAPSAIFTAGAGVGGQIGAEITDFVFILNTQAAVDTFSQAGSITLGGNMSVAVGPLGRNAEMAGSASLKSVAAIFSYSKTKGLFAGVSLEGSMLIERREANRKFYGPACTAKQILSGRVDPPPECDILFRVLDSRAFQGRRSRESDYDYDDDYYNDIPDNFSDSNSDTPRRTRRADSDISRNSSGSWEDDFYNEGGRRNLERRGTTGSYNHRRNNDYYDDEDDDERFKNTHFKSKYSDNGPRRPSAPKPNFGSNSPQSSSDGSRRNDHSSAPERYDRERRIERERENERRAEASEAGEKAVALFTFEGQQGGDLAFRKGDIITIVKRSNSRDDWWTGRKAGVEGIFPANYVELV
jgi:lipid-binding SYLF domain-containing protein